MIARNDKGDIRSPVDMRLILGPIRARQRPGGFLGVFKGQVCHAGPVTCDVIERAMVDESLDRSDRQV